MAVSPLHPKAVPLLQVLLAGQDVVEPRQGGRLRRVEGALVTVAGFLEVAEACTEGDLFPLRAHVVLATRRRGRLG